MMTRHDFNVNHKNVEGYTPLMLTCKHKIYHLLKYLLAMPTIDLSIRYNDNKTAFTVAHNYKMNDVSFRIISKDIDGCYKDTLYGYDAGDDDIDEDPCLNIK